MRGWQRTVFSLLSAWGWLALSSLPSTLQAAEGGPNFTREIRPVLAKNCFACHGPDESHREGGLRLDIRIDALRELDSGKIAIVPGKSAESELIVRITSEDNELRMPPAKIGHALKPSEIALVKEWIDAGAEYAGHWAFQKPVRPDLPAVKQTDWPKIGLDFFVLAELERRGWQPSPEADPHTLIRRVSLDLRGLPPTPAEVESFISDKSPQAYEQMIDRMLADPAYGERWARVWLDLSRYADSKGLGSDPLRTIWRYRDWVIDAYNSNMPYNQFTIEQIAGDLLPEATLEQKVATAMHRNTMTNTEGGTDDEEFRTLAVKDRVDTTMQVWMGVTIGCAKCHNHKYDPITQQEYYQFYAIFNQTADADRPDESPTIEAPAPTLKNEMLAYEAKLSKLREDLKQSTPETQKVIQDELAQFEKNPPKVPTVPVMQELPENARRKTFLMHKGNFLETGEEVTPALPAVFPGLPEGVETNRLSLGYWLMSEDNPLTARVAVNRYWAQLFGAGMVETEEDFGTQGELPTNPKLLDWLATEYMELEWDTKAMLKTLLMSQTYKQSSRVELAMLKLDPNNRYYARGPRFRLEAEMVRDQALALSGLLSRKMYGPSVFPPQPDGLWQAAFNGERTWATSQGDDRYRRGLYVFWRRTVPYPSMATFDAPSREICTIRRIRTNTPLQAFVTLNDPVYVEAAQSLARRLVKEGGATPADRARFGLQLCLARPAQDTQVEQLVKLYEQELTDYQGDTAAATKLATEPLGQLPEGMDPAELAAWTVVSNVLLNLDGVLTK
jgi:hypothetical protein